MAKTRDTPALALCFLLPQRGGRERGRGGPFRVVASSFSLSSHTYEKTDCFSPPIPHSSFSAEQVTGLRLDGYSAQSCGPFVRPAPWPSAKDNAFGEVQRQRLQTKIASPFSLSFFRSNTQTRVLAREPFASAFLASYRVY